MPIVTNITLFMILAGSGFKDAQERRIPNKITLTGIIIGWILGLVTGGMTGFTQSLLGTLVGMAIFFLPFALGGMGAGDVKLLGAVGSLMGWRFSLYTALYSALVGLVIVLYYLIRDGKVQSVLRNIGYVITTLLAKLFLQYKFSDRLIQTQHQLAQKNSGYQKIYIPYGVAIAIGALFVWLMENGTYLTM